MSNLYIRETRESDVERLFDIRGRTRQNPVSRERLAAVGITPESWATALLSDAEKGWVCVDDAEVVGFCQAEAVAGEVLVMAVLPDYEGRGVGKRLLAEAVAWLRHQKCPQIWLAASPNPNDRSHAFYRAQGWRPTGERQANGDEILVLGRLPPRTP